MNKGIITAYKGESDLREKIIKQYLENLRTSADIKKSCLSDKTWASTGSEYHIRIREEFKADLAEIKNQINILKSK